MFKLGRQLLITQLILITCACSRSTMYDFPQILERDTLTVITLNTSTSYFIYRDQEMGYHYDMIREFSDEHGLELQVVVARNVSSLVDMLRSNRGDLIAYNVPVESALKEQLLYCGPSDVSTRCWCNGPNGVIRCFAT